MPHKQGHAKNTRMAQGSINDESMGGLDQMGHIPMIRKRVQDFQLQYTETLV